MSFTVFYAWQSDRDQGVCHYFIRDAAKAAVKEVAKDAKLKSAPSLDHDIQGEVGLIHIADTVKRKIRRAGIFIADLTHVWTYRTSIGRKKRVTNANVAIELGYAMRVKNPKQFILIMNTAFGKPSGLPFDLRHYSYPLTYDLSDRKDPAFKAKRKALTDAIAKRLRAIIDSGALDERPQKRAERSARLEAIKKQREEFDASVSEGTFREYRANTSFTVAIFPLRPASQPLELTSDLLSRLLRPIGRSERDGSFRLSARS